MHRFPSSCYTYQTNSSHPTYPLAIGLITFIAIASLGLTACQEHIAPDEAGIVQAYQAAELNVDQVNINRCIRHNGVEESDARFDFYQCDLQISWIDPVTTQRQSRHTSEILTYNGQWYLTR